MLRLIVEYWVLIVWVAAVLAARVYGGWRLAFVVASLGASLIAYRKGSKDERESHERAANEIEEKRRAAYDRIDRRGTTGRDVVERLRKGDY